MRPRWTTTSWWARRTHASRDAELEREIAAHLELEVEAFRHEGLSVDEARHAAHRVFGNAASAKEDTRAVWTHLWFERLRDDVRFALRLVRRDPAFSAITLIVLALGIGATTAMFSIVNSVLLRPLPFREPDRLVMLENQWLPRFPHPSLPGRLPDVERRVSVLS
jgi:hypothetical protein